MKIVSDLFSSARTLTGVGEKTYDALQRLNCPRIIDLIWHFPKYVNYKKLFPPLYEVEKGDNVIIEILIKDIIYPNRHKGKKIFKIFCSNSTGEVSVNYFNFIPEYLVKSLNIGETRIISSKIDQKLNGILQISHPDYFEKFENLYKIPKSEIIYELTYGLTNKYLTKIIDQALEKMPEIPEWLPRKIIEKYGWPSFTEAIKSQHSFGKNYSLRKERLVFDEFLANQLSLIMKRKAHKKLSSVKVTSAHNFQKQVIDLLPYQLTNDQKKVLEEINLDLASGVQMTRLLQGDVGSGKTIIALLSGLSLVELGYQVCIMAPTDILANQHYEFIENITSTLPIKTGLLTGKIKGKKRESILKNIETNSVNLIIGTHAVFQEKVVFANLAMIIIDEQHRFGVGQRSLLAGKGYNPHILYMTATPIPRSLTMMIYGDLDKSFIREKPADRLPIKTHLMSADKLPEIVESLQNLLDKKEKIYWICPLIEEKEELDLAAAEARYQDIKKYYGDKVGLLHGKMAKDLKERSMQDFAKGEVYILVSTTVVEVGMNVPEATAIIIEQADRFGLSQLHQLRGRVGRNDKPANCLLVFSKYISQISRERLRIMKETEDGFLIAEKDLTIRGGGDLIGTRQSGDISFKVANLEEHQTHLYEAQKLAEELLKQDPDFLHNPGLKTLLEIFGLANKDQEIGLML